MTPDHTIRTKNWPLIAPPPQAGKLDAFRQNLRTAIANFIGKYQAYFDANNRRCGGIKQSLDPNNKATAATVKSVTDLVAALAEGVRGARRQAAE